MTHCGIYNNPALSMPVEWQNKNRGFAIGSCGRGKSSVSAERVKNGARDNEFKV